MAQTYREQKTVTGDFMRVNIYPVRTYQYGRKKKHKPTGAAQAKLNKERKTRLLSDLVNLNFTKNDLQYKLDYSEFKKEFGRNPDPDEVQREMRNFMRRLKRWYKSHGIELKYIYCSEVGTKGNLSHHHIIISRGISKTEIAELWKCGGVWSRKLYFDKKGCYDLAGYFVKSRYTYRSYTCSKNLKRPQEGGESPAIFKNDYRIRQKQVNHMMNGEIAEILKLYPGWNIAELPEVSQTVDTDTGEVKLPTWGIFITLYLYKPEGLTDPESRYEKMSEYLSWRKEG